MPSFGELLGLLGLGAPSAPPVARTQYPTEDEAGFAQGSDYSYGQPSAAYATGNLAHLLTGSPNQSPMEARNFQSSSLPIPGAPDNYYMRALLAVEGSPLAKLGFDPAKVALDITRDPSNMNIVGMYRPKSDEIYANAFDPSAIVHESIHRGIQMLKDSPYWRPEFNEMLGPNNEHAVRFLMKTKMGNPEEVSPGQEGQKQINQAMFNFSPRSLGSEKRNELLTAMEDAAARYMAKTRPMGPR